MRLAGCGPFVCPANAPKVGNYVHPWVHPVHGHVCYSTSVTCLVRVPYVTRRMSFLMPGGLVDHRWRGTIWRRVLRWRGVARRMHFFRHVRGTVLHCLLRWRGVARRLWRGVLWLLDFFRPWRGTVLRRLLRWRGVARRLWRGVVWRLHFFRRWRGVVLQWLLRWRGEVRRHWRSVMW